MYQIALCEDDTACAAGIQKMLDKIMTDQHCSYSCDRCDPGQLENAILKQQIHYQILLLDTALNGRNGVEFAKKLRELGVRSPIVFISSNAESALSAYAAEPTHYLLKPVEFSELHSALNRVFQSRNSSLCVLETIDRGTVALPTADIQYLEVLDKKILVHVKDGNTLAAAGPLTEYYRKRLPAPQFFFCHRSYVVNLSCVKSLYKDRFILESNSIIPVARRKYKDALCAWKGYLEGESQAF